MVFLNKYYQPLHYHQYNHHLICCKKKNVKKKNQVLFYDVITGSPPLFYDVMKKNNTRSINSYLYSTKKILIFIQPKKIDNLILS